ncbi:MAG TPA: HAD family hydrolase [Terriglobales bacterium]|nr:HAD family hydrolase [Terriglobales bacterium]
MPTDTAIAIRCRGILFDMDGVLIDSTPAVARVWRAWAIEHGFDPDEVVHRAHGRPSLATVREYLPDADHAAENLRIERREIAEVAGIVPLSGALALLASLPPERWAIVTSCTRPLAEARLQAGGLPRPRHFITADDIVNGKPAPDPFLKGAAALDLDPADCLVVEDVPAGVRSGLAAGSRVLALTTTFPAPALQAAGATWIAPNCAALRRQGNSPLPELTFQLRKP